MIGLELWDSLCDPSSRRGEHLSLAFDSVPDGSSSSIAAASRREDGRIHVELIAHEPKVGWLAGEVERLVTAHDAVDVLADPRSPAGTALPALLDHGVKVTEVGATDVTTAHAAFVAACTDEVLAHIGQPELTAALAGAVRRSVGDSYAWSRRSSSVDISPLCAVTLALWSVVTRPQRLPQVWSIREALADKLDRRRREELRAIRERHQLAAAQKESS